MPRALIALLLLAGCGTRVLELAPDSGPPPFPAPFCVKDPNGGCDRCFDQWGTATKDSCLPDAGAGVPACAPKTDPVFLRCLFCGGQQVGCLKCEPPGAGNCVPCTWTDTAATCTLCYDEKGLVLKDTCNQVRPELKN